MIIGCKKGGQMVKKIDKHIKKAFETYGFTEKQIQNGCWLLEIKEKPIAWIAYHKFLERVATKAKIIFKKPEVLENNGTDLAIYVQGSLGERVEWSIGEVNKSNYIALSDKSRPSYRWAMAEKRAKDRVILKLLDISGDLYSEEEADEFKNNKPKTDKEKLKDVTDQLNAEALEDMRSNKFIKLKQDLESCESLEDLQNCFEYHIFQKDLKKLDKDRYNIIVETKDFMKSELEKIKDIE